MAEGPQPQPWSISLGEGRGWEMARSLLPIPQDAPPHTHTLLCAQILLLALLPFSFLNCILNKYPLKTNPPLPSLPRPAPPSPRSLTLLDFPAAVFHPEPCLLVFCFQIASPAIRATFKMLTVQSVIYRAGAFAPEN